MLNYLPIIFISLEISKRLVKLAEIYQTSPYIEITCMYIFHGKMQVARVEFACSFPPHVANYANYVANN